MVAIKGMKMPNCCTTCKFYVDAIGYVYCNLTGSNVGTMVACYERMKDCPLKSIEWIIDEIKSYKTCVNLSLSDDESKKDGMIKAFDACIDVIKEYYELEEK